VARRGGAHGGSLRGIWVAERRAGQHKENAALLAAMRPYRKLGRRYNVVGIVLLVLLALVGGLSGFAAVIVRWASPGSVRLRPWS